MSDVDNSKNILTLSVEATDFSSELSKNFIHVRDFYGFIRNNSGGNTPTPFFYFSPNFYDYSSAESLADSGKINLTAGSLERFFNTKFFNSNFKSELARFRYCIQAISFPPISVKGPFESGATTGGGGAGQKDISNLFGGYTILSNSFMGPDTHTLTMNILNVGRPVIEHFIYPWMIESLRSSYGSGTPIPRLNMAVKYWRPDQIKKNMENVYPEFIYFVTGLFPIKMDSYKPIQQVSGDGSLQRTVTFAFNDLVIISDKDTAINYGLYEFYSGVDGGLTNDKYDPTAKLKNRIQKNKERIEKGLNEKEENDVWWMIHRDTAKTDREIEADEKNKKKETLQKIRNKLWNRRFKALLSAFVGKLIKKAADKKWEENRKKNKAARQKEWLMLQLKSWLKRQINSLFPDLGSMIKSKLMQKLNDLGLRKLKDKFKEMKKNIRNKIGSTANKLMDKLLGNKKDKNKSKSKGKKQKSPKSSRKSSSSRSSSRSSQRNSILSNLSSISEKVILDNSDNERRNALESRSSVNRNSSEEQMNSSELPDTSISRSQNAQPAATDLSTTTSQANSRALFSASQAAEAAGTSLSGTVSSVSQNTTSLDHSTSLRSTSSNSRSASSSSVSKDTTSPVKSSSSVRSSSSPAMTSTTPSKNTTSLASSTTLNEVEESASASQSTNSAQNTEFNPAEISASHNSVSSSQPDLDTISSAASSTSKKSNMSLADSMNIASSMEDLGGAAIDSKDELNAAEEAKPSEEARNSKDMLQSDEIDASSEESKSVRSSQLSINEIDTSSDRSIKTSQNSTLADLVAKDQTTQAQSFNRASDASAQLENAQMTSSYNKMSLSAEPTSSIEASRSASDTKETVTKENVADMSTTNIKSALHQSSNIEDLSNSVTSVSSQQKSMLSSSDLESTVSSSQTSKNMLTGSDVADLAKQQANVGKSVSASTQSHLTRNDVAAMNTSDDEDVLLADDELDSSKDKTAEKAKDVSQIDSTQQVEIDGKHLEPVNSGKEDQISKEQASSQSGQEIQRSAKLGPDVSPEENQISTSKSTDMNAAKSNMSLKSNVDMVDNKKADEDFEEIIDSEDEAETHKNMDSTDILAALKKSVSSESKLDVTKYDNMAAILVKDQQMTSDKYDILKKYASTMNRDVKDVIFEYKNISKDELEEYASDVVDKLKKSVSMTYSKPIEIKNGKLVPYVVPEKSESEISAIKKEKGKEFEIKRVDRDSTSHPVIVPKKELSEDDINGLF